MLDRLAEFFVFGFVPLVVGIPGGAGTVRGR